jgi:hypothetical protein
MSVLHPGHSGPRKGAVLLNFRVSLLINFAGRKSTFSFLSHLHKMWKFTRQTPIAQACSLGYSGGRDKDCSSKPAQANSSWDTISKKAYHKKRAGGVTQGVVPEFKPEYCKKKKNDNSNNTESIFTFTPSPLPLLCS